MTALLMWALVFAAGLVPDLAFDALRTLAHVAPHKALINSSYAITLAVSGYLAVFVLHRCRDAGAPEPEARSKALLAGCMGLAAFLELPNRGTSPFEPRTFLEVWINFRVIPDTYARNVILIAGIGKLFCWWFLFALLLRYYAFSNSNVFRSLPPIAPSHRRKPTPKTKPTEDPTQTQTTD
jgi:hypothetical protein